jgi:hypothetical protein
MSWPPEEWQPKEPAWVDWDDPQPTPGKFLDYDDPVESSSSKILSVRLPLAIEAAGYETGPMPPSAHQFIDRYLIPEKLTPMFHNLPAILDRRRQFEELKKHTAHHKVTLSLESFSGAAINRYIREVEAFFAEFKTANPDFVKDSMAATLQQFDAAPRNSGALSTYHGYTDADHQLIGISSEFKISFPYLAANTWYSDLVNAHVSLAPENNFSLDSYTNACLSLIMLDKIDMSWLKAATL